MLIEGRIILVTVLLAFCVSHTSQADLQPSADSTTRICKKATDFQSSIADNQQYLQQIRSVMPQKGEHFVSNLASLYLGTGQASGSPSLIYDKMGVLKLSAVQIIAIIILVFFLAQFIVGIIFSQQQFDVGIRKIRLFLFWVGTVGFGLCVLYVVFHSARGLSDIPEIQDGFDQIQCSKNQLTSIHTAYDHTYSVYDIPDIIGKYERTVVGIRYKLNRVIWNSYEFLQNPILVRELTRSPSVIKSKQSTNKNNKTKQFIRQLTDFSIAYQGLSNVLTKNASDQDISHWSLQQNYFQCWQAVLSYKNSLFYLRNILDKSVSVPNQILTDQNQELFIQWLKINYIAFGLIVLISFFGIYLIYRHESQSIKNVLIFVIIMSSLLALVNGLILTAFLPSIAWGCEGSNYFLGSEANFVSELKRGHASEDTERTLKMFSPFYSGNLSDIVKEGHKQYFMNVKTVVEKFLEWQQRTPQLLANLKSYFEKQDNSKQNKQKIIKITQGLSQNSFQGLRVFYAQLQSFSKILDPSKGDMGSFPTAKVGLAIKSNVDTVCITNFNNLYEIRNRMNKIGLGLLVALIFLLIIRVKKIQGKVRFQLEDLQQSKFSGPKQDLNQNTHKYNPNEIDD